MVAVVVVVVVVVVIVVAVVVVVAVVIIVVTVVNVSSSTRNIRCISARYARALVQEMNVKLDKGFIIALSSLFTSKDDLNEEVRSTLLVERVSSFPYLNISSLFYVLISLF